MTIYFVWNQKRFENEGGWVELGGNMLMYAGLDGPCYSYGLKEHLAMASSTKFSEKFSLPSLTQPHKLPREKVSLLLLRFQAIILLIKINKNWFLKEKRISFQNVQNAWGVGI
jgi:hypothetical protein